jgi:hypothetical protein
VQRSRQSLLIYMKWGGCCSSKARTTIPIKNCEIVKKSEFFYVLVARFCSLLYFFVVRLVYLNCRIIK